MTATTSTTNTRRSLDRLGAYHRPLRVVVADDDPFTRELLVRVLYEAGYGVIPAADGWEAMSAVRDPELAPHALVTDLWMPRLSGNELLGIVKEFHAGVGRVLFTGDHAEEAFHACLDVRTDVTLTKPFPDPETLLRAVEHAIDAGKRRANRRRYA